MLRFGVEHTLAEVGEARLRGNLESPDGNLIADYLGPIDDPASLASRICRTQALSARNGPHLGSGGRRSQRAQLLLGRDRVTLEHAVLAHNVRAHPRKRR